MQPGPAQTPLLALFYPSPLNKTLLYPTLPYPTLPNPIQPCPTLAGGPSAEQPLQMQFFGYEETYGSPDWSVKNRPFSLAKEKGTP